MYLRTAAWLLGFVLSLTAWSRPANADDPDAIFVMNVDGSEVRKVAQVADYEDHSSPRWSHDGKRLVFDARLGAGPERSCFVVGADGTGLREIAKGRFPDWSPDDSQIALQLDGPGSTAEIYVQNLDGQGHVKIADGRSPRWSPDGSVLAYTDRTTLRSVDLLSSEDRALLPGPIATFDGFAWSPDGKRIAVVVRPVADGPRHLLFADPAGENRDLAPRLKNKMGGSVSYSPDGKQLVFSNGWEIHVVNVAGDAKARKIPSQQGENWHPAFSPDGKLIAFAASRPTPQPAPAKTAAMPTAKILEEVRRHERRSRVWSLDFTPDGRKVVLGGDGLNGVQVWDITTGETRDLGGSGLLVNMFPDGRRFAASWVRAQAHIIDVESGDVLREFDHGGAIWAFSLSRDGRRLLTGGLDKIIRIWDVETGQQLVAFDPQVDYIIRAMFSPDGKEIIGGCHDKTLRVWDAKTGKQRLAIEHPAAIWGLAVTQDGRHILTGTGGNLTGSLSGLNIGEASESVLRMWDRETGKLVHEMKGHDEIIFSIDVSPDERLAVTGSGDATMRLWDLTSGRELSKVGPGKGLVACVRFSPDGKLVIAGGGVMRIQGRIMEFPNEQIRVYKVLDAASPAAAQK